LAFLGKILAPVEFSERCAGAVRYAKALAEHFNSELTLLHVVAPAPPELDERIYADFISRAERRLEEFEPAESGTKPPRRLVVKGDPARKIVQYAQNEHADLILMATHGFGPFRSYLLGSNTAKVLHDADVPVWTGVHIAEDSDRMPLPIRRILCAVDLGPQSWKALAWAAELQKRFGAELTILHAMPVAATRDAAENELGQLKKQVAAEANMAIEPGEPPEVICAAAARLRADVLVIGRGSAAGVFGRLRANAYGIIRQSPCPVVSV